MKRLWLGVPAILLALAISPPVHVEAQAGPYAAQIQRAITALTTGARAFTQLTLAASSYLNFGTTAGTGGYGIRDNAGAVEFKNSGGAWAALVAALTGGTCTNQFVTVIAASTGIPTCTTATLASAQFANQGTTTTLLHGNGAGNPSFAAVSLTADVSGVLPVANGGTGLAASNPGVLCSNTAASTTITGTNVKTYFSLNCAVAANAFAAGKTLSLRARGVYSGNATDTIVLTLEACQVSGCASGTKVTLATSGALTLLALTNQFWELNESTIAFTIGGTGTLDTQGLAIFETASTTITGVATPNTGTATVDTTAIEYFSMSVTFSTNSGNDSITLRNLVGILQ